jgi:hypothetical protein
LVIPKGIDWNILSNSPNRNGSLVAACRKVVPITAKLEGISPGILIRQPRNRGIREHIPKENRAGTVGNGNRSPLWIEGNFRQGHHSFAESPNTLSGINVPNSNAPIPAPGNKKLCVSGQGKTSDFVPMSFKVGNAFLFGNVPYPNRTVLSRRSDEIRIQRNGNARNGILMSAQRVGTQGGIVGLPKGVPLNLVSDSFGFQQIPGGFPAVEHFCFFSIFESGNVVFASNRLPDFAAQ